MHKLSIFAVTCVTLGLGFASSTRAETPTEAQMAAPPAPSVQEGDDVLEVLLLPLEAVRLEALGVPREEVKLAVAVFQEAGMSPGDAASVVRLEEAISKRRGVRKGFGQHVLAQVAEGKNAAELARSLREREDAPDADEGRRKELMKAVTARRKVELAKVADMRKRVTEKRSRGERVMIRGQMRLRGVAPAKSMNSGPTIDVAWLEKRLMRVQQRMIRIDQQRTKLEQNKGKGQGKALARGDGLDKQRERLLAERAQLTDFIKRMKELDADGRLEGSARDTLLDEIKTAFAIEDRPAGAPNVNIQEMERRGAPPMGTLKGAVPPSEPPAGGALARPESGAGGLPPGRGAHPPVQPQPGADPGELRAPEGGPPGSPPPRPSGELRQPAPPPGQANGTELRAGTDAPPPMGGTDMARGPNGEKPTKADKGQVKGR